MQLTFHLILALVPLVAYVALLCLIALSPRPFVTTAGRDTAALAVGLGGLFAVGPAELFFPTVSASILGPMVWFPLAVLYSLCVSLYILTRQQRLVIYGSPNDELFEATVRACKRLDAESTHDFEQRLIHLSTLGVHLRLENYLGFGSSQLLAFESNLSGKFWSVLLGALRQEVQEVRVSTRRSAVVMLLATAVVSGVLLMQGIQDRAVVVEGFRDWFWR